jgi:SAM-dependent methyltransferase
MTTPSKNIGKISADSVDVFTWNRHGNRKDIAKEAAVVQAPAWGKDWLVGTPGFLNDKIILDAGCGGGNKTVAMALKTNAKLVIGLDGSETALAAAKDLASETGAGNVKFVQGYMEDCQEILNNEGVDKVDFVFNSFNLHHVDDYKKLLSVFSNILKPGGQLLTIYVAPDTGLAGFFIKNRIAYGLGRTKEQRMKIGKALFGWYDKKFNINKANIDWDSFYADRYSAFYSFMPTAYVLQALRETGFEVIETKPPLRAYEFLYKRPNMEKAKWLIKFCRVVPFGELILTFFLRIHQFLRGGDTRGFLCVKTSRPNLHSKNSA